VLDWSGAICYVTSMSTPVRKTISHDVPDHVRPEDSLFFVTICTQPRGVNQLCFPDLAERLFESVAHRQARGDWWVDLLLLMPDHLHALVASPSDKTLAHVIGQWKRYTTCQFGIRWQRDFFEHRLRRNESAAEKADYILKNPVRAGIVDKPKDWPYVWTPPAAA
jgi:putative transposase